MTEEQFKTEVWKSYYESDYQVRYWGRYEYLAELIQGGVRVLLGLAGVLAIAGLGLKSTWAVPAAWFGAVAAVVSNIVIPSFDLHNVAERLKSVRNEWVGVRLGYKSVWDEIGSTKQQTLEKRYVELNERFAEIERESTKMPPCKKFQNEAYEESQRLLC
jgi:hypothetical protein